MSTGDGSAPPHAVRAVRHRRAVRPRTSGHSSQAPPPVRATPRGTGVAALVGRIVGVAAVAWLAWVLTATPLGLV